MPRLRSQSSTPVVMRSLRSSKKSADGSSTGGTVDCCKKSVRSILKEPNPSNNIRPTRSSSTKQRSASGNDEPAKNEKRESTRRSIVEHEIDSTSSTAFTKSKVVLGRRKRKTNPPESTKVIDPYDFDLFVTSDDEKENVDPMGTTKGKKTLASSSSKPGQQHQEKPRKGKVPTNLLQTPNTASPMPLSGRPSVHFGGLKRITLPVSSPGQDIQLSAAEQERRRSASATILLSLPQSRPTVPSSSICSLNALSASTPATQASSTGVHVAKKDVIPGPISPFVVATRSPRTDVSRAPLPSSSQNMHADEVVQSATTTSSRSHSEDRKELSHSSHDRSGDSKSSSTRRSRQLSDSDRAEAYSSWLEDFNAQLEKFESHQLTVVENE